MCSVWTWKHDHKRWQKWSSEWSNAWKWNRSCYEEELSKLVCSVLAETLLYPQLDFSHHCLKKSLTTSEIYTEVLFESLNHMFIWRICFLLLSVKDSRKVSEMSYWRYIALSDEIYIKCIHNQTLKSWKSYVLQLNDLLLLKFTFYSHSMCLSPLHKFTSPVQICIHRTTWKLVQHTNVLVAAELWERIQSQAGQLSKGWGRAGMASPNYTKDYCIPRENHVEGYKSVGS